MDTFNVALALISSNWLNLLSVFVPKLRKIIYTVGIIWVKLIYSNNNLVHFRYRAFNMFKAYKRPQNLDFDSRGACRRTLPKLAVSFHAGDLVYSIDMSRKEARSELKESGSPVVAPASLSTPDNGRAGKHPLRSGRVAEHMKIYGKESKGRAGVFKVVKVSGHKRTSQEAE